MRRGDLSAAQAVFQALLDRNHNDADALHWMGVLAVTMARPSEAADYFERLSRLKPRDAATHANLARTRLAGGDAEGALAATDRALKLQPTHLAALAAKADALNHLGHCDEAISLLSPIVDRGEEDPDIAHVQSTMLSESGRHEDAAALARKHFEGRAAIDPAHRRLLGFTLGRCLDALDRVDDAFEVFARANAIEVPGARFNPAEFIRTIDEEIEFFTPARLHGLLRASDQSDLPVLVVGIPRSGSTLVEQIIHAHPEGFGAGELPFINHLAGSAAMRVGSMHLYPHCLQEMDERLANAMAAEYIEKLGLIAPGARRIVDKNLLATVHLGFVWQLLPGATVIHCRRDPIANGFSCFISPLSPRLHPYASDLSHIGLFIRQVERLMAHWRHVLDLPILTVQYEELVADQQAASRGIVGHIGLEWDDACLRYHTAKRVVRTLSYAQVRRPIYTAALERHRRYERFLQPLRAALTGDL